MATLAPHTHCMICGKLEEYRPVIYRGPPRMRPTDWELVPHEHTQEQLDEWLKAITKDQ